LCWDVDNNNPKFKPPADVWINDQFQQRRLQLVAHVWFLCNPAVKVHI
jgi:hypothetical protein